MYGGIDAHHRRAVPRFAIKHHHTWVMHIGTADGLSTVHTFTCSISQFSCDFPEVYGELTDKDS